MSILSGFRARLRALRDRQQADRALDDEIRFHLELETEKHIRAGRSPAEARRLAVAHFGGALAVVGVYGVLAQISRNRTREMGIRIALGAQASEVRWLVVRQGLGLTALGLVIGGAVAHEATRAMMKLLFEVQPNDPLTLWSVAALLALTSVAAAWLPARRASRADPAIALRAD